MGACYPYFVDGLDRARTYLTRLEVFPGWDAWTLIPAALALLALAAAVAYYAYSRSRSAEPIDWDIELGVKGTWITRVDLSNPVHRVLMTAFSVLIFGIGAHAIWTGHFSSYDVGRYSRGRYYSTDGAPAVAAGALLCIIGVMLCAIVVFRDSEFLNRRWGPRKPS
jgi:hypothetical protein